MPSPSRISQLVHAEVRPSSSSSAFPTTGSSRSSSSSSGVTTINTSPVCVFFEQSDKQKIAEFLESVELHNWCPNDTYTLFTIFLDVLERKPEANAIPVYGKNIFSTCHKQPSYRSFTRTFWNKQKQFIRLRYDDKKNVTHLMFNKPELSQYVRSPRYPAVPQAVPEGGGETDAVPDADDNTDDVHEGDGNTVGEGRDVDAAPRQADRHDGEGRHDDGDRSDQGRLMQQFTEMKAQMQAQEREIAMLRRSLRMQSSVVGGSVANESSTNKRLRDDGCDDDDKDDGDRAALVDHSPIPFLVPKEHSVFDPPEQCRGSAGHTVLVKR